MHLHIVLTYKKFVGRLVNHEVRAWTVWHTVNPLPGAVPAAQCSCPSTGQAREAFCESPHLPVKMVPRSTGQPYTGTLFFPGVGAHKQRSEAANSMGKETVSFYVLMPPESDGWKSFIIIFRMNKIMLWITVSPDFSMPKTQNTLASFIAAE